MEQCSNISYLWGFIVLRSITKIKKSITDCYKFREFFIFFCALNIKNVGLRNCPEAKIAPGTSNDLQCIFSLIKRIRFSGTG
jgi:hypothetical protein